MPELQIKPNMLLGVSDSATQIDGGDFGHTWNLWHSSGRIKDNADPKNAADHWKKWYEDILLLARMGVETYKFSIEWSRIEPTEGVFDEFAIDKIKEKLLLMIGLSIRPIITLHCYTNPTWFEAYGGWAQQKNIVYFLRYVERIVSRLGHLCDEYITINEPNAYAYNGYHLGTWPPGKKNLNTAFAVMSNMAGAHIRAYRLIHRLRSEKNLTRTSVGITIHMRVFAPKSKSNPAHVATASMAERFFQTIFAEAVTVGKFSSPMTNVSRAKLGRYCDFHGLNYYTRSSITKFEHSTRHYCAKSDLGWEIYPQGMILCAQKLLKICNLPIYITENGVCDNNDSFRCRFIYDHLSLITSSPLPIERYYYRSYLDGFEWLHGTSARFGLVHVNFETGERFLKKSGKFYSKLIKERQLTEQMHQEFLNMQTYHH